HTSDHTPHSAPHDPSFTYYYPAPRPPHSFPTRRSSDLAARVVDDDRVGAHREVQQTRRREEDVGAEGLEVDLLDEDGPHRLETRSEEHTSELQSRGHLVCRLLLEKKNRSTIKIGRATTM